MGGDDLGGPPPLEDLPVLSVLIVLRRNHHHPFAFVQGGWCGCSFDHGKGHDHDGRWRARCVGAMWRRKVLVRCCCWEGLRVGCWRGWRSRLKGWVYGGIN